MKKLVYLLVVLVASSCAVMVPTETKHVPVTKTTYVSSKKSVKIEQKTAKKQAKEQQKLSQQKR